MTPEQWEQKFHAAIEWLEHVRRGEMTVVRWAELMLDAGEHCDSLVRFARYYYDRNKHLAEENAMLKNEIDELERKSRRTVPIEDARSAVIQLSSIVEEFSRVVDLPRPSSPIRPEELISDNPDPRPDSRADTERNLEGKSIMSDVRRGLYSLIKP